MKRFVFALLVFVMVTAGWGQSPPPAPVALYCYISGNAPTATNVSTSGAANQVWGMNSGATAQGWQTVSGGGGSGTMTNAFMAAATGGADPGSTFNGSVAVKFDYHSFGAQPAGIYVTPTTLNNASLPASFISLTIPNDLIHPNQLVLPWNTTPNPVPPNATGWEGAVSSTGIPGWYDMPSALPTTPSVWVFAAGALGHSVPKLAPFSGTINHATCWKTTGTLGSCSTVIAADGSCTCS